MKQGSSVSHVLSNIVRQHSDFASERSSGPCLTASNHEIQENLLRDESVQQSCLNSFGQEATQNPTPPVLLPELELR